MLPDSGFHQNLGLTSVDYCLQDEDGNFIKAFTVRFNPILTVKEEEARGLLHALSWVKDLGIQNVIFELDSKTAVYAIEKPREDI